MQTYEKFSIDSMRLRCDMRFVTILDKTLVDDLMIVNSSGEIVDDDFKRPKFRFSERGITTYIAIERQTIFDKTRKEGCYTRDCLVVLLNAKMLKNRYLEGITFNNIDLVYEFLMSLNVFHCSKGVFYKSFYCYDIDIKKDFHMSSLNFEGMISLMKKLVIPTSRRDSMPYSFNSDGYITRIENVFDDLLGDMRPFLVKEKCKVNLGIEFGKRCNATQSRPYLKYYYKWGELNSKSKEFNETYCINPVKDLVRQEFTIRDKRHLKNLTGDENQSNDLLSVIQLTNFQDLLLDISRQYHKKHFSKMVRIKKNDDFKLQDEMFKAMTEVMLESGGNMAAFFTKCERFLVDRKVRYRFNKKVEELGLKEVSEVEMNDGDEVVQFMMKFLPSE